MLTAPDRKKFGRAGLWLASLSFFCLILGAVSHAAAATFTASLDRDTITLGESATLSLAFTDGQPQEVPNPPQIANLQISYIGPSSQFSFINGQVSSSVTHTFTLTPKQPGDYIIPALTAVVGKETLKSQAVILKVLKPAAPSPDAIASGNQPAFLKLVLPRKEVYVGESFSAQLQIYLSAQHRWSQPQMGGFPADGFNVGKLNAGQNQRVQVGNGIYIRIPVDVPLKAIKAGPLTLGPVNITTVLNPRDPFADPFGMFGGGGESRQLTLATPAETVQSLPLPRENMPTNFNGAIGNFSMTVSAGPTNLTVGDPITLKIQITGRGSLDSLTLAELSDWRGFKVFSPTSKLDYTDPLGLQGTKTFEEFVAPQSADIKELPPVSFSYFDPDRKQYRTLNQPAVALTVRAGASPSAPSLLAGKRSSTEPAPPAQDIVGIKQRLGAVAQAGLPLIEQTWFLALQGVPFLAFFSAFVWRRRADNLANNPRLRRRRQVAQLTREGLNELRHFAAGNRSDEFVATLVRLLQEQLGERLDMPASAITEAVIEEKLRPRGVAESTLNALQELFQICNLARYAAMMTSQELTAIIPKVEGVLRDLQGL